MSVGGLWKGGSPILLARRSCLNHRSSEYLNHHNFERHQRRSCAARPRTAGQRMSDLTALLSRTTRIAVPRWLPLVAVFAFAAGLRGVLVANPDVSWGLTMAEKILNGQQLYVDVIETNPPAAMFLFVVPAWLAGLAGVRAEFVVGALVLFAAALSLWLAGRILVSAKLLAD